MTRLLLVAALTMRTCESGIGTASAADVYANETGWWHHGIASCPDSTGSVYV